MNGSFDIQVSFRIGRFETYFDVWLADEPLESFVKVSNFDLVESILNALLDLVSGSEKARFCVGHLIDSAYWKIRQTEESSELLDVTIEYWSIKGDFLQLRCEDMATSFQVDREFFVSSLYSELNKIASQFQFPGFRELCGYSLDDFPWKAWHQLQQWHETRSNRDDRSDGHEPGS